MVKTVLVPCLPLVCSLVARAGDVTGVVTQGGKPLANAAVWFEGGARGAPIRASIDQRDRAFSPHVSVVPVGTTVVFPNNDQLFHNVFLLFNRHTIDLGTYPRGQSRRYRFEETGVARFLCRIHSEMNAYLVVVPSAHYAVTDTQGRWRVRNVPVGDYTLRVWHESGATHQERAGVGVTDPGFKIEVPRKGGT